MALCGLVLAMNLLAGGCARYEYDVVEPQDLAQHVGKQPVTLPVEPLAYHLRSVESRLVMVVENPTGEPVKLLGDDSFVVDPDGRSHPLRSQTIAPESNIKLIFPPVRPRLEGTGPSFGIGVGVGYSRYGHRGYYGRRGFYDPFFYDDLEPRYYSVVDDGTSYWDWEGETAVRVTLVYERGGEGGDRRDGRISHRFVFRRGKV
jgi:hypothetical protein